MHSPEKEDFDIGCDLAASNIDKTAEEALSKMIEEERYEAYLPKHKKGRTKPLKRHKKRNKK